MPVVQIQTNDTRVRLYEQNEKVTYDSMNQISGANSSDAAYDHLINLALGMMGEFGSGNPRPLGFKTSFVGNQVTIGKGIIVRSDGIFKFSGGTFTVNAAAQSGIYEVELSTLYDTPIGKEYINILTETIASGSGNSRKNFQLKLYENYTNVITPPSVTVGRIKLFEYVMDIPGGTIQTIRNPIVVYENQNGKVPLSGITYVFDAAYAPTSGVVNSDGFMLADGSTVPSGYALSGWVTPNLVDGSYIEGSTSPSLANVGSNSKTLSAAEMPIHSHTMSGTGSTVVTDVNFSAGAAPGGYTSPSLSAGALNRIKNTPDYQNAMYLLKQSIAVGGSTGLAGSSVAFDLRSMRKQGIPLVRVN